MSNLNLVSLTLEWMPTPALEEFIKAHWYYLPESINKNTLSWMLTMQELICELNSRDIAVTLTLEPTKVDNRNES